MGVLIGRAIGQGGMLNKVTKPLAFGIRTGIRNCGNIQTELLSVSANFLRRLIMGQESGDSNRVPQLLKAQGPIKLILLGSAFIEFREDRNED